MKRFLGCPSGFILIIAIGMMGLVLLAAQRFAPTKTESASEKFGALAIYDPWLSARSLIDRIKNVPFQPSDKHTPKFPVYYDREWVEALARSVTFPPVLDQGEFLISFDFPNAAILCLDAAYYAGKAQGLILAMDRDTVVEHKLFWTIDNASDLFHSCLGVLLQQAIDDPDDPDANNMKQLEEVKQGISKQVQAIQIELRFAKDVKIENVARFAKQFKGAVGLRRKRALP